MSFCKTTSTSTASASEALCLTTAVSLRMVKSEYEREA